ncbi:MAG: PAS domain-containing protein [Planctomycetota bacterium]
MHNTTNQADLLAGVLDSSLDGIIAFSSIRDGRNKITDFRIEFVNRMCEDIVGRSAAQMLGRTMLTVFPGNKEDGLFDAYARVVETGEPFYTEHHYAHDGLNHWFSIKAAKCGDGFTVTFCDITARKTSEEHFRVLFESSTDSHLLFDDTGIINCNQAAIDMLGYDNKQEILQLHPAEMSPEFQPDGRRSMEKRIDMDQTAREQGLHRFDWMHQRKDGSNILVAVTLKPVKLPDKEALLVVCHDLTERAESERKLRESAQQLSEAQTIAKVGNWQWTNADNKITWSDQIKHMFGLPIDQPAPSFEEHRNQIHPDDVAYWESVLAKAAEDHQPYVMKFRSLLPNGESRVLESRGQCELNEHGELIRTYGTVQDVTEQREQRQELEAQRHRLEFALKASNIGLWDWDIPSGDNYLSDTWYTMLGYEPSELPMRIESWHEVTKPDDLDRAKAALEDYFAGRTARYACEIRVRNKAGDFRWVLDTGEAIERDEAGNVTRMIGLHIDIHKLKTAQQELIEARDLAQQASAAKSAFVANMSHEIRTPMNAILGFSDLLLDVGQTEADKRNHAQTIRRNGKHLLRVLNDILDLSKIEAGKMSIESVTIEPAELFEDAINLMAPRAGKKGISLNLVTKQALPTHLKSDPTRLRQVVLNLVGNAVKFTQQGHVTLEVEYIPNENGSATLRCVITDTGIGISPEQQQQLFTPFSQADQSTTRKFGGTGLGLTISHNLCQMMGGDLTCTSAPGGGSTFTATFQVQPVQDTDSKQTKGRQPTHSTAADTLVGKRVLIVEDGPDNQRLLQHYTSKAGATVEVAENGKIGRDAALAALKTGMPFDVILMDMQMPVLDGYNATAQLRDFGYDLPIIALTAHASADDRDKCLQAGCTDYMSKPVDRHKLIQIIADYMSPTHHDGAGI